MTTPRELGGIFKEKRKEQGLSLEDAGRKSRIHFNVLRDIESGVFDRLGKPYVKGFLKKYAAFLGIDQKEVLKAYENVSGSLQGREFSLAHDRTGDGDETIVSMRNDRTMLILAGTLAVVLFILLAVLVGMMVSRFSGDKPLTPVQKAAEGRREKARPEEPPVEEESSFFGRSRKTKDLRVTLRASGEVWVMVKDGDKTVFADTMKKGEEKTIDSAKEYMLWTGKAENLELDVNGRDLGNIARGVVKNIHITADRVTIGDSVAARLD
jgi:transcriptional regulator with XRE-family HTH domain